MLLAVGQPDARVGDTFTTFYGSDGTGWTQIFAATVAEELGYRPNRQARSLRTATTATFTIATTMTK